MIHLARNITAWCFEIPLNCLILKVKKTKIFPRKNVSGVSVHWLSYEDVLTWVVAVKQRFVAAPLAGLVTDEISSAFVYRILLAFTDEEEEVVTHTDISELKSQLKIEVC